MVLDVARGASSTRRMGGFCLGAWVPDVCKQAPVHHLKGTNARCGPRIDAIKLVMSWGVMAA